MATEGSCGKGMDEDLKRGVVMFMGSRLQAIKDLIQVFKTVTHLFRSK